MKAKINDLFLFVNDLLLTKKFYSELLELEEIWVNLHGDKMSYVVYTLGNEQKLHFYRRKQIVDKQTEWALQPGSQIEESKEVFSFTLEYDKEQFKRVAKNCIDKRISHTERIVDRGGYYALTIQDPDGLTIDIYTLDPDDEL